MSRRTLYILLAALSLSGYLWIGWNEFSPSARIPEVCIFKAVTHLPCPSCGTTRSVQLLLQGNVTGSVSENPLGIVIAFALLIIPLWLLVDCATRRETLYRWYMRGEVILKQKLWISIPLIAVVVINWAWNIVKGI